MQPDLQPGHMLHNDRYHITKRLDRGGFGVIYLAEDWSLRRTVAIKENQDTSAEAQRRFQREAHLLARLNAQYRKFIDAGGYTNQVYWDARGWAKWNEPKYWDDSRYDGTDQPVVGISWYETQAYANWLSTETGLDFGLPTEAQWEKAARGTDGRIYPWGNKWDESKANGWGSNDDYRYTAPVGSYPKGASPYSIVGMSGNVREWTLDWYANDYYKKTPSRNPQGPASGERRVLRGGSWLDNPNYFRTTFRVGFNPAHRDIAVGFRLVRHDKEE